MRERRKIDSDIVGRALREEDKRVLRRAEDNLNEAIDKVVQDYEKELASRVEAFESLEFREDLRKELEVVKKELQEAIDGQLGEALAELRELQKTARDAEKAAAQAGDKAKASVKLLADGVKTLQKKIEDAHKKAADFGDKLGVAVAKTVKTSAAAAKKALTGM